MSAYYLLPPTLPFAAIKICIQVPVIDRQDGLLEPIRVQMPEIGQNSLKQICRQSKLQIVSVFGIVNQTDILTQHLTHSQLTHSINLHSNYILEIIPTAPLTAWECVIVWTANQCSMLCYRLDACEVCITANCFNTETFFIKDNV